jgi:hypothetical protein
MSEDDIEKSNQTINEENSKIENLSNETKINEIIKEEEEEEENKLKKEKKIIEIDDGIQPLLPFATSFLNQFYYLSKRSFSNFIRNIFLFPAHFISSILVGLLLGAVNLFLKNRFIGNWE